MLDLLLKLIAAAIPVVASVLGGMKWNRREKPLATAERLVPLIDAMPAGPSQDLLKETRDHLAVDWALQEQAPRFAVWAGSAWTAFTVGCISWVVWLLGLFLDPTNLWPWLFYIAGLVFINGGQVFRAIQLRKSRGWVEQERRWRGLPRRTPEFKKTMELGTAKRLLG